MIARQALKTSRSTCRRLRKTSPSMRLPDVSAVGAINRQTAKRTRRVQTGQKSLKEYTPDEQLRRGSKSWAGASSAPVNG